MVIWASRGLAQCSEGGRWLIRGARPASALSLPPTTAQHSARSDHALQQRTVAHEPCRSLVAGPQASTPFGRVLGAAAMATNGVWQQVLDGLAWARTEHACLPYVVTVQSAKPACMA